MEGSKQRPADLREFMSALSIHHKLSSQEQHMLDQLVLSRNVIQLEAEISDLQDQVYDLEDTVNRGEHIADEIGGFESQLKELKYLEEERQWSALLDKLVEGLAKESEGSKKPNPSNQNPCCGGSCCLIGPRPYPVTCSLPGFCGFCEGKKCREFFSKPGCDVQAAR